MLKFIADNSKLIILICIPIMGILVNIIIYILSSRRLTNLYESKIDAIKVSLKELSTEFDTVEIFSCVKIIKGMYATQIKELKEDTKFNFLCIILFSLVVIVPAILY